jgi:hypothetical protein
MEDIDKERGHTGLGLPQYHCELNHAALVRTQMKHHTAMKNATFRAALLHAAGHGEDTGMRTA